MIPVEPVKRTIPLRGARRAVHDRVAADDDVGHRDRDVVDRAQARRVVPGERVPRDVVVLLLAGRPDDLQEVRHVRHGAAVDDVVREPEAAGLVENRGRDRRLLEVRLDHATRPRVPGEDEVRRLARGRDRAVDAVVAVGGAAQSPGRSRTRPLVLGVGRARRSWRRRSARRACRSPRSSFAQTRQSARPRWCPRRCRSPASSSAWSRADRLREVQHEPRLGSRP
jgi:hypothetical protein